MMMMLSLLSWMINRAPSPAREAQPSSRASLSKARKGEGERHSPHTSKLFWPP